APSARRRTARPARARPRRAGRAASSVGESKYTRAGSMAATQARRIGRAALCACLGVLLLAATGGAATRVAPGKMTVTPIRVPAGSTNELTFGFLADTAALRGTALVDVPRGWSKPQQTAPAAPGYVEVQALTCPGTRISAISGRRIVIAAK